MTYQTRQSFSAFLAGGGAIVSTPLLHTTLLEHHPVRAH